jgi:hypothetical protein
MNDTQAMDHITAIMNAVEWNADTLDNIADIVRDTGRNIDDV